ncbi:hypothetical protein ABZ490_50795 [Streptomyces sp. NPDC005811]|uniref:hypothetical protein n=1 Tax=Streptomyces sp. NPDC005811 TaxID=3154565 RepID=UPI0033F2B464
MRADMVFAVPGHEVMPLLFVEVGNGAEGLPVVADKVQRYRRCFARRVSTGTSNRREVALWRTVWPATRRDGCPPVALVFTKSVVRVGESVACVNGIVVSSA